MKKASKILAIILIVTMLVCVLCACNGDPNNNTGKPDTDTSTPGGSVTPDTGGGNTPSVNPNNPDTGGSDTPGGTPDAGGGDTPGGTPDAGGEEETENAAIKGYIDLLTTNGYTIKIVDDKAGLEALNNTLNQAYPTLNVTILKYTQATKKLATSEPEGKVFFEKVTNASEVELWKNYIKENNVDTTGVYYEYVDNTIIGWDIKVRTDLGLETPDIGGGDNPGSNPDAGGGEVAKTTLEKMIDSLNAKNYPREVESEEAIYKEDIEAGLGFSCKEVYCYSKLLAGNVNLIVFDNNENALRAFKMMTANNEQLNYDFCVLQVENIILVGTLNSVCDAIGVNNEQLVNLYDKLKLFNHELREIAGAELDMYEQCGVKFVKAYSAQINTMGFGLFVCKDNADALTFNNYVIEMKEECEVRDNIVIVAQKVVLDKIDQILGGETEETVDIQTIITNLTNKGFVEDTSDTLEFRKDATLAELGVEPENCLFYILPTAEPDKFMGSVGIMVCKTIEDAKSVYNQSVSFDHYLPVKRLGKVVLQGPMRSINNALYPDKTEAELVKETLASKGCRFTNYTEKELNDLRTQTGVSGIVSAYNAGYELFTTAVITCDNNTSATAVQNFAISQKSSSKAVDNIVIISGNEYAIEEALDVLRGVEVNEEYIRNSLTEKKYTVGKVDSAIITEYQNTFGATIIDSIYATGKNEVTVLVFEKSTVAKKIHEQYFSKIPSRRLTNIIIFSNSEEGVCDALDEIYDGGSGGPVGPDGPDGPDGPEDEYVLDDITNTLLEKGYNKVIVDESELSELETKSKANITSIFSFEKGTENVKLIMCATVEDCDKLIMYYHETLQHPLVNCIQRLCFYANNEQAMKDATTGNANPDPQPVQNPAENLSKNGYKINELLESKFITFANNLSVTFVESLKAVNNTDYVELYLCSSPEDFKVLANNIDSFEVAPEILIDTFEMYILIGSEKGIKDAYGSGNVEPDNNQAVIDQIDYNLRNKGYSEVTTPIEEIDEMTTNSGVVIDDIVTLENGSKNVKFYYLQNEKDSVKFVDYVRKTLSNDYVKECGYVCIVANNMEAYDDATTDVIAPVVDTEKIVMNNLKKYEYITSEITTSPVFDLAEKNQLKVLFSIKGEKLENYIEVYRFAAGAETGKMLELLKKASLDQYKQYVIDIFNDCILIGSQQAINDVTSVSNPEQPTINPDIQKEIDMLEKNGYTIETYSDEQSLAELNTSFAETYAGLNITIVGHTQGVKQINDSPVPAIVQFMTLSSVEEVDMLKAYMVKNPDDNVYRSVDNIVIIYNKLAQTDLNMN